MPTCYDKNSDGSDDMQTALQPIPGELMGEK